MNLKQLKKHFPKPKQDLAFEFGQSIIDFRVKHGLSPEKLCKLVGIGKRTLNKLESL